MRGLVATTIAVHEQLDRAGLVHAFGGALSLAYYGQPRATRDIDLNVFVGLDDTERVVDAFGALGLTTDHAAPRLPINGMRFRDDEGGPFVDAFLTLDPVQDAMSTRIVLQPFGSEGRPLPFLSAEDVVVFKLSIGRSRDWVDLEDIVGNGTRLDLDYVEATLVALRGPTMYPRIARFRAMARGGGDLR